MRAWADVAYLAKARNQQGRFVAKAAAGLPFLLEEGDEVSLVPPQLDLARTVRIASVEDVDERTCVVVIEPLDGGALSRDMVGMHMLARRAVVERRRPEQSPGLWESWSLIDEQAGFVGTITGVADNPAHPLLEVSGPKGDFLVPVVDDIIVGIDVQREEVHARIPGGLMDLNG